MKKYTKQELKHIVESVMNADKEEYEKHNYTIVVVKQSNNELLFEATIMYEPPHFVDNIPAYKQLKLFSEAFKTDNIDIYDEISIPGCDTFDYGSSYGFALRVWE